MQNIKSLNALAAFEVFQFLIEGKKVEILSAAWANGHGFRQALFRFNREHIKKGNPPASIEVVKKSDDGTRFVLEYQIKKENATLGLTGAVPYSIVE